MSSPEDLVTGFQVYDLALYMVESYPTDTDVSRSFGPLS